MINCLLRATSDFARRKASQSAAWAVFARDTVSGFVTTAHHTLMVLGILAIGALGIMFVKPDIADQLKVLSPFTAEGSTEQALETPSQFFADQQSDSTSVTSLESVESDNPKSRQQEWVTTWLSKRYRVASDALDTLVSAAYLTAKDTKLDPLLILSVMAIESGFNPFAESPVGAQGLMQVMSKIHRDKFDELGGMKAALDPVANIRVGSMILKDYVKRGGSIEAGLKLYVGAGAFDSDYGYGSKVLAEYRRLQQVALGKKVPVYTTSAPPKQVQQERKIDTAEKTPKADAIESAQSGAPAQPMAQAEQVASAL
jgi:hypothetical protein